MIAAALPQATTAEALAPVRATLRAMAANPAGPPLTGIAPDLGLAPNRRWVPATALVSGDALDDLLDQAKQRWRATPHAAAALAWKCYSFWLALPAVLGYAVARRVPLLRPDGVMVTWSARQPFLMVGLTGVEIAVLGTDPLAGAATARSGLRVVERDEELLELMRESLMDEHLAPILDNIKQRLHLGRRTLWGSLASGVAQGLSRAAAVVPGPTLATAEEVLAALGVADLVTLAPRGVGLDVYRKTCCLAFTLPEPKICAGCCIR